MTATLSAQPTHSLNPEQRLLLRRIPWQQCKAIQVNLENLPGLRLAYFQLYPVNQRPAQPYDPQRTAPPSHRKFA
jgi:hypothetical protein